MATGEIQTNFTTLLLTPMILASQPNINWIDKLKTEDQAYYYLGYRRRFYWTAKCWASRNTFQNDPLRPLLNAKWISRNEYNIIWSSQSMFERLWALCQLTEPFVREVFEQAEIEYPFPDAISLFAQVVEEMVDAEFALCLEPYTEFSRTKREKSLRLQAKACAGALLTKAQKKIVAQNRGGQTLLIDFVLRVARRAAKKELIIRHTLEDYRTSCSRLLKCLATEVHNLGGYKWVDGRIVKESKPTTEHR